LTICCRGVEKYFKRGSRLRWPEGAVSRESINAVKKLGHLKVCFVSFSIAVVVSGLDFNKSNNVHFNLQSPIICRILYQVMSNLQGPY
jgi:hypothetical protein